MIGVLEQNRGLNQTISDRVFPIIDYSSYGLFYMHAPFRSQQSVTLNSGGSVRPLIIKRSTNVGDWYAVDYDVNNTISPNSNCRALDALPNLRLGDVLGVDNWDIVRMYNQLEFNYYHSQQLTNVGKLRFATGGLLESKGGVFCPRWLGVSGFNTGSGVKSEFNSGSDVSFISVYSSIGDESFGTVLTTSSGSSSGLYQLVDRRTSKRNAYMFAPTAGFFADNLLQRNDDGFFVQAVTINGTTKLLKSYINGVFQNQVTFSGSYGNNGFVVGAAGTITANVMSGYQGALLCGAQEWSATQVADLTDILKQQFLIP